MAIYHEDIVDIELTTGNVRRTYLNHVLGEGDANGDRFGVRVLRDGQEVDLTGVSCSGYFVRADGTTEALQGNRTGAICYVELPQACYAKEGNFTLSIKLSINGQIMTARIVDGTIVDTAVGSILDPSTVIPDLSAFTDLVERAEAAAEKIEGITITNTLISGTRYMIEIDTE